MIETWYTFADVEMGYNQLAAGQDLEKILYYAREKAKVNMEYIDFFVVWQMDYVDKVLEKITVLYEGKDILDARLA